MVPLEEIAGLKNDFNLNLPRYIDSSEPEDLYYADRLLQFPLGIFAVALGTTTTGELVINDIWPAGVPAGVAFYLQYWIEDTGGPFGFSASNALVGTTP